MWLVLGVCSASPSRLVDALSRTEDIITSPSRQGYPSRAATPLASNLEYGERAVTSAPFISKARLQNALSPLTRSGYMSRNPAPNNISGPDGGPSPQKTRHPRHRGHSSSSASLLLPLDDTSGGTRSAPNLLLPPSRHLLRSHSISSFGSLSSSKPPSRLSSSRVPAVLDGYDGPRPSTVVGPMASMVQMAASGSSQLLQSYEESRLIPPLRVSPSLPALLPAYASVVTGEIVGR